MGKVFIINFLLLILFTFPINTLAQNNKLEYPTVTPDSMFYPMKRGWEKLLESIAFSREDKYKRNVEFLDERLDEMNYVVDKGLVSENQRASERYSFYAGSAVDNLIHTKDKEGILQLSSKFVNHKDILGKLRDRYESNSSYWLLVQQNIDTIDLLNKKINELPL